MWMTPSFLCAILLGSYAQEKLTSSYPLLDLWLSFNQFICAQSLQVRLTFCDPMHCSLPGSSIHGILQVRILEWVAISFSRGSSPPRNQTHGLLNCRQILYRLSYEGSPMSTILQYKIKIKDKKTPKPFSFGVKTPNSL